MLRQCLCGLVVSFGCVCVAASVNAQSQYTDANPVNEFENNSNNGNTQVLSQHHASTALEGALRGEADWMRGYGEGMHQLSEAAVAVQEARDHALRNNQMALEMYYGRKAMYKAYYESQKPKSMGETYGASQLSKTQAVAATDALLTDDGRINWPEALQTDSTHDARQKLECFFAHHGAGYHTGLGTAEYAAARLAMDELTVNLKSRISELAGDDYIAAKKFLKNLDDEARKNPKVSYVAQARKTTSTPEVQSN